MKTGTPQGTCFSPTLFNIIMKGLPNILEKISFAAIYADDTSVIDADNTDELLLKSNICVNSVCGWCECNGVKLIYNL